MRTGSPATAIERGVAHVPEDRTGVGSAPNLSLADNLIMKSYRDAPIARGWLIDDAGGAARRGRAQGRIRDRRPIDRHAGAPAVRRQPPAAHPRPRDRRRSRGLMVAVQPTRGLDVGAIETRPPAAARPPRRAGAAILLISEELDEILALSDRVDVMYEGRVVGRSRRPRPRSARSGC